MENDSTRDRVRALVREVLAKAAPESAEDKPQPQSRFVNTVPESGNTQTAVTRDESAKSVITEDDVRGLESGAVLRIGEDARLTPLAQDVVNEKKIEIVRRASRRGSKASGWSWAMDTWVGCQSRPLNASAQVFSVLTSPIATAITMAATGGRERIFLLFGRVIMQFL